MQPFNPIDLQKLYIPSETSHKGQNGKLLFIGGSSLFHAASLWSLETASRIVDMVFYASVQQNNDIVTATKKDWRGGIVVPQNDIEKYIEEADAVLIGPGMMRKDKGVMNKDLRFKNIQEIIGFPDEVEQEYYLTKYLLQKYPHKKWIIDAGALQMLDLSSLATLQGHVVITPNITEFERIFDLDPLSGNVADMAAKYNCIIVLKRYTDTVCNPLECVLVEGGNAGMTKGGTGDVLSGLIASLACKNDLYLAAKCGSYINKKAGESLYKKQGLYFNASDLALEIPKVMEELIN